MQELEIWRDVVGYEGYYQVSNMGNVRSIDRWVTSKTGVKRFYKGVAIKQNVNPVSGYYQVGLRKKGKHKTFRVHCLVAMAFLENEAGLSDVDHIDCDKSNNTVNNLRYVSHADNMRLAQENGRFNYEKMAERLRNPEMRAIVDKAHMKPIIRDDGAIFESIKEAAKAIGCHPTLIGHQLHGRVKTCKGWSFKYATD